MKNFGITAAAAVMVLTLLLVAACAPRTAQQPQQQPVQVEQPVPPATDVPEIAQAEQSVDEIGVQELDEIEKDADELVLP